MTAALLAMVLVLVGSLPARAEGPANGDADDGRSSEQRDLAAVREAYLVTVTEHVQRSLFYPAEARRDALTGMVILKLVVNAKGGVVRATVARSTGHPTLDEAAITSVLRAAPFPEVPSGLPSPITLMAPVHFGVSEYRPPPRPSPCRRGSGARGTLRSCR
jgi:periplasmic protein TonB